MKKPIFLLLLILFFGINLPSYSEIPKLIPRIKSIKILSGIGRNLPDETPKYPSIRDRVYLYALIKAELNGKIIYFINNNRGFILNGIKYGKNVIKRWNRRKYGSISVNWYKVEWNRKKRRSYSNTSPDWHWDKIDYMETPFKHGNSNYLKIRTNCTPTNLLNRRDVGTMRFKLKIKYLGKIYRTPGRSSIYHGGLKDNICRISRLGRSSNPLIRWVFSFYNLPYIWGSAGKNDSDHQSERYIGADCADLIVAAARRAGYDNISYCSTKTLKKYTKTILSARVGKHGYFTNIKNGKIIKFGRDVKTGDLIFGHRHVGFLYRDRGRRRILDVNDTIIHTLFKEPVEESLKKSKIFSRSFEVLRLLKNYYPDKNKLELKRSGKIFQMNCPNYDYHSGRTHIRSKFLNKR